MKKVFTIALLVLVMSSFTQAQYKGKYEGWSVGYVFQGTANASCYKAFTHLMNFQVTVSGSGAINTGSLSGNSSTFVTNCHNNGDKAIVCIGGAGQSGNFSNACASASTQTTLVKNIINLVRSSGYDGVDLDWEEGETSGFDGNATKVAMFKSFHKEMRDTILAHPPLLMTAAVATDWYPNGTAAIAPYVDQLNNMSYYNYVTDMNTLFAPVLAKGVAKSLQGVGFGWDTDNEITDPNDILAKCRYAIDNGYGGIMAWDITSAPTWVLDSIARYVTHNPTSTVAPIRMHYGSSSFLFVKNNRFTGPEEISYTVSPAGGSVVDLGMYDMKGALVKTLFHGQANAGTFSVPRANSGEYVFKLSSGFGVVTAKAVIAR
jgi:hypothetical protein